MGLPEELGGAPPGVGVFWGQLLPQGRLRLSGPRATVGRHGFLTAHWLPSGRAVLGRLFTPEPAPPALPILSAHLCLN